MGIIAFNVKPVREHLLRNGRVFTVRTYQCSGEKTAVQKSGNNTRELGTVKTRCLFQVTSPDDLAAHVTESGLKSIYEWYNGLRRMHGNSAILFLIEVELVKPEKPDLSRWNRFAEKNQKKDEKFSGSGIGITEEKTPASEANGNGNEISDLEEDLIEFYRIARSEIASSEYSKEIEYTEKRKFADCTPITFFLEYVWVVLNAGMRNQVAAKIFERFIESKMDLDVIGHTGKREAIWSVLEKHERIFKDLEAAGNKIEFLKTLPWIGDITKYHLARNLGIDCAKPDRHLVRISERFGFNSVQQMCKFLSEKTGDRIGTVDVVLWRYSNLHGS